MSNKPTKTLEKMDKCNYCKEKANAWHETKPICQKCWNKLKQKFKGEPVRQVSSLKYLGQ